MNAGEEIQLRCESQGGNPAPILKWFIDDQELDGSLQKNETDIGNERRWNAYSIIKVAFQKVNFAFLTFTPLCPYKNSKLWDCYNLM